MLDGTNVTHDAKLVKERQLLEEWNERVTLEQRAHYEASLLFGARKLRIGVPSVILSTIVGTAVFASLSEAEVSVVLRVITGTLSVVAAILAALQTFLGYSERGANHQRARTEYGKIRRTIEQLLVGDHSTSLSQEITDVREQIDAADEKAPDVPNRAWKKAKAALEAQSINRQAAKTVPRVDTLSTQPRAALSETTDSRNVGE